MRFPRTQVPSAIAQCRFSVERIVYGLAPASPGEHARHGRRLVGDFICARDGAYDGWVVDPVSGWQSRARLRCTPDGWRLTLPMFGGIARRTYRLRLIAAGMASDAAMAPSSERSPL